VKQNSLCINPITKKNPNHCEILDKSDLHKEVHCRHAESVRISPVR